MNYNIFSLKLAMLMLLPVFLTGCYDEGFGLYDEQITEGEVMVSFGANFQPFASADLTRAEVTDGSNNGTNGNCMKDLEDLCILVYDEKGNLVRDLVREISVAGVTYPSRNPEDAAYPDGNIDINEETACLDFKMSMPVGKYYIIAVANLGYDSKNTYHALTDTDSKYYDKYNTLHDLRNLRIVWDYKDIAANNAMLGYFENESNSQAANANSTFPLIDISSRNIKLKGWLRRCASKITVDFDGSALRDNVYVYIKDVKVKNIVADCTLGFGKVFNYGSASAVYDYNNSAGEKKSNTQGGTTGNNTSADSPNYVTVAPLLADGSNK